jgi:hypothetical protein
MKKSGGFCEYFMKILPRAWPGARASRRLFQWAMNAANPFEESVHFFTLQKSRRDAGAPGAF